MILDKENLCSDVQNLTTGTVFSTNAIDQWGSTATIPGPVGTPGVSASTVFRDPGRGDPPEAYAQIVGTADPAGGTSMQVQVGNATDNAGTGFVVLLETVAILLAALVRGYQFRLGSLPPGAGSQRYLLFRYVLAGTFTASTLYVTAGLTQVRQTNNGIG